MSLSIVILAAGKGKRMRSTLPKVLHHLAGISLLERVVRTAQSLNPSNVFVVYGNGGERVRRDMAHLDVTWVEQKEALGTGHALLQVLPFLKDDTQVLILYGDVPLISKDTLEKLLKNTPKNALGLIVAEFPDPTGFGRIVRNETGNIIGIIEHKDANEQQLKIREINTGIMTAPAHHLKSWLPQLSNRNNQNEYYLTDIVGMAVEDGYFVGGVLVDRIEEVRGVNNLHELANLERAYQWQKAYELMMQGVTMMDPHRFDLRGELITGKDVCIDVNVIIEGKVTIGSDCTIGANTILRNVQIGNNVKIEPNSIIENSVIGDNCVIGPFARFRAGNHLGENVRIGNFVEVKNSQIAAGSKAAHLSYLGDAVIGENVNIGCGTITVNYDGASKHQTIIEDNAFVGCDSQLVAPVTIGKNAYIGAGSTITSDAPANQLTIARSKQRSIEGWKPKSKSSKKEIESQ